MILSDLERLSDIFNDTKHRAVSLRQLSFLNIMRMRVNLKLILSMFNQRTVVSHVSFNTCLNIHV